MALREKDLEHSILKKVSIDEFEPKTGDEKDVAVVGFYLNSEAAGTDLYNFVSNSVVENRDVELSPNANEDGYHMVFDDIDRSDSLLSSVKALIEEVERLSGKLNWQLKTPYLEEYVDLNSAEKYIQQDPESYLTAADYKSKLEADFNKANEELQQNDNIMEFLQNSNLYNAHLTDGVLHLEDARNSINLEVLGFGNGPDIMEEIGIKESAIDLQPDATLFNGLRGMLGEMKAIPIDNYVVIYDPSHTNILVTKPC